MRSSPGQKTASPGCGDGCIDAGEREARCGHLQAIASSLSAEIVTQAVVHGH